MKITYSLSIDDYIAVNQSMANTTPEFAKQYKSIRIAFSAAYMSPFLAAALIASGFHYDAVRNVMILIAVLLGTMYFFGYPKGEKKLREKNLRNFHYGKHGTGSIGSFDLELRDKTLWLRGARGARSFELSLISEIIQTSEYVLLRSGYLVYPLPRGKITEGDLNQFVSELELRTPPPTPLLTDPFSDAPDKSFIGTSRRAFIAAAISCLVAAGFVILLPYCNCGTSKTPVFISLVPIGLAICFLNMAYELRYKEKKLRKEQAASNTTSQK